METVSIVRLLLGVIALLYSVNCWINQRFWSRKDFDWKPKEHWPEVFWLNIVLGLAIGTYMILSADL